MNFFSFSLRRSGTHPLASWILSQNPGTYAYFHNCMIHEGWNVFSAPMVTHSVDGMILPLGIPTGLTPLPEGKLALRSATDQILKQTLGARVKRAEAVAQRNNGFAHNNQKSERNAAPDMHQPENTILEFSDPFGLSQPSGGKTFFGSEVPEVDSRYYGYENATLTEFYDSDMSGLVNPDEDVFIVWLRDPLDNLASLIRYAQKQANTGQASGPHGSGLPNPSLLDLDRFPHVWNNLAEDWLDTMWDLNVVPILYEEWSDNEDYRNETYERLGLKLRTDKAMGYIPKAGGGSSFEGVLTDASAIRKRSKGREMFASDAAFAKYVDLELIPLIGETYEAVYGKELDVENR